jgi:excisionase family DNA binding protein
MRTLLTPGQAARLLNLSPQRVRQMADEGRLPCDRTPLGRLFPAEAVEALARERAAGQVRAVAEAENGAA